jgi:hypothetical protein
MFLVFSDDIKNHPFWSKALILAACVILAGPAWGFFSGLLSWHLRWERVAKRATDGDAVSRDP